MTGSEETVENGELVARCADGLEQDVRKQMRDLAELRLRLGESERESAKRFERLLLQMLEVTDAFDRVFQNVQSKEDQATPQMKAWLGNFRTVKRLLDRALSEQGVVAIQNLDAGFDPNWHKAAEMIADPSKSHGTIVKELKRGYIWGNQALRKTEVAVVSNDEGEI